MAGMKPLLKVDRVHTMAEVDYFVTRGADMLSFELTAAPRFTDDRVVPCSFLSQVKDKYPAAQLSADLTFASEGLVKQVLALGKTLSHLQWSVLDMPADALLERLGDTHGRILTQYAVEHDDSPGFMSFFASYRDLVDLFQVELLPEYDDLFRLLLEKPTEGFLRAEEINEEARSYPTLAHFRSPPGGVLPLCKALSRMKGFALTLADNDDSDVTSYTFAEASSAWPQLQQLKA
jgi:hypothetical protein